MKQLNFFEASSPVKPVPTEKVFEYWKLFVDGASRNNPGPAGAGICIKKDNATVKAGGAFLGTKTNNQAEYMALLLGLFYLKELMQKGDLVLVVSDSQLLVRQLQGLYRVKEPHLKPLFALAKHMLSELQYDIAHVLREDNTDADEQANIAVDKKTKIPEKFLAMLREHEISI